MPLKTTVPTNPTMMIFTSDVDQTKASPDRAAAKNPTVSSSVSATGGNAGSVLTNSADIPKTAAVTTKAACTSRADNSAAARIGPKISAMIDAQSQAGVGPVQVLVDDHHRHGGPAGRQQHLTGHRPHTHQNE